MSQDSSFLTGFPRSPGPSGHTGDFPNTAGFLNHNINCFNINNVANVAVADDRSEILTWLSPLEPRLRHYDIQTRRVENVGDWLLRTEQFRRWRSGSSSSSGGGGRGESQKATMFCSGNPGVGKTYIR